jgi:hypothetical protein
LRLWRRTEREVEMERIKGRTPSPATVISIVALIFAVTGSALAGVATVSVLSKKEKKQTRKIANKQITKRSPGLSVKRADIAANADALQGKPASAFASSSNRTVQAIKNLGDVAAGSGSGVQANCDPGEQVVGGGASANDPRMSMYQSWPVKDLNEWAASFTNLTSGTLTGVQLVAFVICASP